MSLRRRKMIEEAFGWIKTAGGLRKSRHKGLAKLSGQAVFTFAAYNLRLLLNLMGPRPSMACAGKPPGLRLLLNLMGPRPA
jgi:hypothetical protein